MKILFRFILLFFAISYPPYLVGQEIFPIVKSTTSDYLAGTQNWSISQGPSNTIYIANNQGLLHYNGEDWALHPAPNNAILRSVLCVEDKIFAGSYMNFGYWLQNPKGELVYTSISDSLNFPLIEDEHFWNIFYKDNYVIFQSLDRIYLYHLPSKNCSYLESASNITKMYQVGGKILFQKLNEGIFEITNGKELLLFDNQILQNNLVVNIFQHNDNFLFITQDKGIYLRENNKLVPWNESKNSLPFKTNIYSAIQTSELSIILGTISNGVFFLDQDGKVTDHINQEKGLSNNTVLSLLEDVDKNIWIGLDNGVNCLNVASPFKVYNDNNGTLGSVYVSALYEGKIYLGTNQGLFAKAANNEFELINNTQGQVWELNVIDGKLFCGHHNGTIVITIEGGKEKTYHIPDAEGTWKISEIQGKPELLIQGNYNGLHILEKKNDKWIYRNRIQGFDSSSRFFEWTNDNTILVNHEHKGVFKILLDDQFTKAEAVSKIKIDNGLNSGLVLYKNIPIYAFKQGIFSYQAKENTFIKDTILSKLYTAEDYNTGKLIYEIEEERLWSFSVNNISFIQPDILNNEFKSQHIPISSFARNDVMNFENILKLKEDYYLLGTTLGYLTLDLKKLTDHAYEIKINNASFFGNNHENINQDLTDEPKIEYSHNNLLINYSIPQYNKLIKTEYQYSLSQSEDNWSRWTYNSSKSFENLSSGDYVFKVRGKVGNTLCSNAAHYSFSIAKPWYLSNLLIVFYLLSFLILTYVLNKLFVNYYINQRQKRLFQKEREIAIQKLEADKELIRIRNSQLEMEFESKSRELGQSTFSIIKKNELLSKIKKELSDLGHEQLLKPVITTIDKNLTHEDDWNLFQTALNNADKNFLTNVKHTYPNLTHNDLRLCAYLRLNLSSKEIAQLLNISTKSVEIKRYRLRKKMDLDSKTNLISHILGL